MTNLFFPVLSVHFKIIIFYLQLKINEDIRFPSKAVSNLVYLIYGVQLSHLSMFFLFHPICQYKSIFSIIPIGKLRKNFRFLSFIHIGFYQNQQKSISKNMCLIPIKLCFESKNLHPQRIFQIRFNSDQPQYLNMSIRVQRQGFISALLRSSTNILKLSQAEAHYVLASKDTRLYFKCREFPKVDDLDQIQAKNILQLTTIQFQNQITLSRAYNSKYTLDYTELIISYPYAVFVHQPIQKNLSRFMEQRLNMASKIRLMTAIAQGVSDFHANNICLRALRPSTIIVSEESQKFYIKFSQIRNSLVINDKDQRRQKKPSFTEDSSPYLAPEVLNFGVPTLASDIWSLGIIFYQVISEKRGGKKSLRVEALQFSENMDGWTMNFIKKMTHAEAKSRYKIKDVLMILKNAEMCYPTKKSC